MAVVVDMLPTPAAIVRTVDDEENVAGARRGSTFCPLNRTCFKPGPDASRETPCGASPAGPLVDGKEQRAKEEQVLPIDIDTIGNIIQGMQCLRIYCFPKTTPFNWNTGANRFLLPLPENAEHYAPCTVHFFSLLLEHTETNKDAGRRATSDESRENSLAELRRDQDTLFLCKYRKIRECEDPKPFLCQIMNLIEFTFGTGWKSLLL